MKLTDYERNELENEIANNIKEARKFPNIHIMNNILNNLSEDFIQKYREWGVNDTEVRDFLYTQTLEQLH